MAGLTLVDIVVFVSKLGPISGITMTELTVARVMGGGNGRFRKVDENNFGHVRQRQILRVARQAIDHPLMIKLIGLPGIGMVALVAPTGKMIRIQLPKRVAIRRVQTAGCAFGRL